jgi:hypothetical protein
MMCRILRHPATPALFVAASAPACSSPSPAADTFVNAIVQPAGGAAAPLCPWGSQQSWIQIGTAIAPEPTRVSDGNTQGGGRVTANCSVHPSNGGFDVQLNAALSGRGSVTITSASGQGQITTAGGKGINATFEAAAMGTFSATDCTVTYTYNDGPVPQMPPVAAGKIWGHISCPDLENNSVLRTLPDGGSAPYTCDGEADFLFEFCGQ